MNGANSNSESEEEILQDALSHFSYPSASYRSLSPDDVSLIDASSTVSNRLPLIPSDCNNVHEAMENFVRVFESKYGELHPFFTPVSFHELVSDAQSAHHSVRKPALVYIHDDNSITTNVFCTQVLCAPAMVEFINLNFTLWPWDFTFTENRAKLLDWIDTVLGHQKSIRLRSCSRDEFPVLLVLGKMNGAFDVLDIIKGSCDLQSIMCQLINTVEMFHDQMRQEATEEVARKARERVRSEQEAAFQESLEADELKHKLKIEEERKKEFELQRKLDLETAKERERTQIEKSMPAEPAENCGRAITKIRVKTPDGENLERRFLLTQPIGSLFDFMATKNYSTKDYKVFCGFPKTELTIMSVDSTFDTLKFGPREVVVMEAR